MKEIRVKNNSPDWFDAEIHEEIDTRDKLFAKFKKDGGSSAKFSKFGKLYI